MAQFPCDTYFFINCWTWGYEDILKATAREFNSTVSRFLIICCPYPSPTLASTLRSTSIATNTPYTLTSQIHFYAPFSRVTPLPHVSTLANVFTAAITSQLTTHRMGQASASWENRWYMSIPSR